MIIYDLEIQNLVPPRDGNRMHDFKYCEGWQDYKGMGLACAAVYDYSSDCYSIYDDCQLEKMQEVFTRAELIVGFNIINFDNNVMHSYDFKVPNRCYDLLREIAKAAGTPNDFKGLSLDAVIKANFANHGKTGDGANAPILYQQKRFAELHDYCMKDVYLTKKLTDRIIRTGRIINPRNHQEIIVRKPG